jgi:hypothetical protein
LVNDDLYEVCFFDEVEVVFDEDDLVLDDLVVEVLVVDDLPVLDNSLIN